MQFIDTHTHLNDPAFGSETPQLIAKAQAAGVTRFVVPAVNGRSDESLFALCTEFPCCHPAIGLHPTEVKADFRKELETVERYAEQYRDRIVAIGEVGLDAHWSTEFMNEQVTALEAQIETALRRSLPLILHTREAVPLMKETLTRYKGRGLKGVFHGYSGSAETFRELEKLGDFYFGIGGVVTFKNARLAETVKAMPAERIVLETDSPYLTPHPYRGRRNDSSHIPLIAARIAEVQGTDLETIAEITTRNSKKLFGI